jgi:hypothetical protein
LAVGAYAAGVTTRTDRNNNVYRTYFTGNQTTCMGPRRLTHRWNPSIWRNSAVYGVRQLSPAARFDQMYGPSALDRAESKRIPGSVATQAIRSAPIGRTVGAAGRVHDDQLRRVRQTQDGKPAVAVEEPHMQHAAGQLAGCARRSAAVDLVRRAVS